ncbi:hypothetical protein WJX74_004498 [Apatococcus lobatus]|uniref:Uncharacterized protein n=1 Tax=Apatococcus lobatus TaxID=904363 RepID=A0AAW1QBY6_9CHLO
MVHNLCKRPHCLVTLIFVGVAESRAGGKVQEQLGLSELHGGYEDTARHEQYDFQKSRYHQKIRANTSSYALPERLQNSPASCTPQLLRTDLLSSAGDFYETTDGNYYFEPAACLLRRLSGHEARQCLAGRHLDFIGDSVTRYQYMSLVDFLSQKQYQAPYGDAPGSPSMSMYWEWGDWSSFYQGSQQKLAQAVDATAVEACRCRRSDTPQTFTQEHQAGRIKEDREFILVASPNNASDRPGETIRISYEQVYDLPTFHQAGLHGLIQSLRHRQLLTGPPSTVIMNQGIWAYGSGDLDHTSDPYRQTALQSIIDMGDTLVSSLSNTELLWKTTSVAVDDREPLFAIINANTVTAAEKSKHWTVYNVRSISEAAIRQGLDFMTDNLHFIPLIYEQFNDLLLNMMCNTDNTWYEAKKSPGSVLQRLMSSSA